MLTPIAEFTDVIFRGRTHIRQYNTGTLDTTGMTSRFRLTRVYDGTDAGLVQSVQVDEHTWALVISYSVTNELSPDYLYDLTIDFDDSDGNCLPHGIVHCAVSPGPRHS